jgi:hypothetical protein
MLGPFFTELTEEVVHGYFIDDDVKGHSFTRNVLGE